MSWIGDFVPRDSLEHHRIQEAYWKGTPVQVDGAWYLVRRKRPSALNGGFPTYHMEPCNPPKENQAVTGHNAHVGQSTLTYWDVQEVVYSEWMESQPCIVRTYGRFMNEQEAKYLHALWVAYVGEWCWISTAPDGRYTHHLKIQKTELKFGTMQFPEREDVQRGSRKP